MKIRAKQFGLSLVETIVVVAVVAMLIGVAIPAVKSFLAALKTPSSGIKIVISSTLSSARSLAAKHQKPAGIRFQEDANGVQYMIPIIYDYDKSGLANGFIYLKGIKPLPISSDVVVIGPTPTSDAEIDDNDKYNDRKAFSVIFSPSGSLVIRKVRISDDKDLPIGAIDSIFNDKTTVDNGDAQFYKDNIAGIAYLVEEDSVNNFVICNKKEFESIPTSSRYTDFIGKLETMYINSCSGSIINQ